MLFVDPAVWFRTCYMGVSIFITHNMQRCCRDFWVCFSVVDFSHVILMNQQQSFQKKSLKMWTVFKPVLNPYWQILGSWIFHVREGKRQDWCLCFWRRASWTSFRKEAHQQWVPKGPREPGHVGKFWFDVFSLICHLIYILNTTHYGWLPGKANST